MGTGTEMGTEDVVDASKWGCVQMGTEDVVRMLGGSFSEKAQ